MEGDFDPPAVPDFLTEKNVGVGAGAARVGPDTELVAELDNFSSALIRCEIPEPRFIFLAKGGADC